MTTTPSQLVFTEEVQTSTIGDQVPDPPDGSLTLFCNENGDWYAKNHTGTVVRVGGSGGSGTVTTVSSATTTRLTVATGTTTPVLTVHEAPPSGTAGGDLSGTYPTPDVAKVPSGALVAGSHITITTTSGKAKITGATPGSGTVTTVSPGTGTSVSVTTGTTTPKIKVAKVPTTAVVAGTHISITTDSGKAEIAATTHPTGDAGGDLSGTYPTPDVAKVPSGALVAGSRITIATTSGKAKITATTQTTSKVSMGGDISGTSTDATVAKAPSGSLVAGSHITITTTGGKAKITGTAPGSGTVTDVTSSGGTLTVSTGTTTPNLAIAKVPTGALVAGTDITIATTSGKAKISASGGGSGTVTTVSSTDSSVHVATPTTTPKLEIRIAKKAVTQSTTPTAGQLLYYTSTAGKWIAHTVSSGSGTVTTVASENAAATITTGTTTPKITVHDSGLGGSYRPTFWYGFSCVTGSGFPLTKGKLYFIPFNVAWTTFKAKAMAVYVVTDEANSSVRLGIYADGGANKPTTKILDAGTVATTTTGRRTIAISHTLSPGVYWLCIVAQTSGTAPALGYIKAPTSVTVWTIAGYGTPAFTSTTNNEIDLGWVSTGTTHSGALPTTAPALTTVTSDEDVPCCRLQAT